MTQKSQQFDLKLLTTSKDVGLRRLRSYAATLGGGAQIFHAADDLILSLENAKTTPNQSVVLHDNKLIVTPDQLYSLRKLSRVFQLHQPESCQDQTMPQKGAPCWDLESYMRFTMTSFFDSAIVRMSMAQLCKSEVPLHLEHLLRWGYSSQTWHRDADEDRSVADASYDFVRALNLSGEGRRLAEMSSHFIQSYFEDLGLRENSVTFGSDGLTTMVIAKCSMDGKVDISRVANELRVHEFPIAMINQLSDTQCEVGALYHTAAGSERLLMKFKKKILTQDTHAETPRIKLGKAG